MLRVLTKVLVVVIDRGGEIELNTFLEENWKIVLGEWIC